ncbi:predicted protein [Chaetoceros tenuissimus]|uniref:Uncharacterized protein n=1 Tax=Chaetoceros tenuissimus TaxID=426638 RepID=A0AAD3CRD2_9STRA|nr:predicted protein [Chaetoceros tenuissimus]
MDSFIDLFVERRKRNGETTSDGIGTKEKDLHLVEEPDAKDISNDYLCSKSKLSSVPIDPRTNEGLESFTEQSNSPISPTHSLPIPFKKSPDPHEESEGELVRFFSEKSKLMEQRRRRYSLQHSSMNSDSNHSLSDESGNCLSLSPRNERQSPHFFLKHGVVTLEEYWYTPPT